MSIQFDFDVFNVSRASRKLEKNKIGQLPEAKMCEHMGTDPFLPPGRKLGGFGHGFDSFLDLTCVNGTNRE
jgi:hypothetical protein